MRAISTAIGVLGGPVIWFLHLCAVYVLVPFACAWGSSMALHVISALALAAIAAAGLLSASTLRRAPEGRSSRQTFLGRLGLATSALFFVVTLADALPTVVQDPCLRIDGPIAGGLLVGEARAHVVEPGAAAPPPETFWRDWNDDPVVVAPLALLVWLYARGLRRLWRNAGGGRGVRRWEAACAGASFAALGLALVSPVDALGSVLFSAHMVQHLLLMLVAAPLFVLGVPHLAFLRALPRAAQRELARLWRRGSLLRRATRVVLNPFVAWTIHAGAIWLWHLPGPYELALRSEAAHALEHASFFGTAVVFWWVVVHAGAREGIGHGMGVIYVFTMAMQGGILGLLILLAEKPWYSIHVDQLASWPIGALEDQQLAGLIMWIPSGVVYTIASLALVAAWLAQAGRRVRRREVSLA